MMPKQIWPALESGQVNSPMNASAISPRISATTLRRISKMTSIVMKQLRPRHPAVRLQMEVAFPLRLLELFQNTVRESHRSHIHRILPCLAVASEGLPGCTVARAFPEILAAKVIDHP